MLWQVMEMPMMMAKIKMAPILVSSYFLVESPLLVRLIQKMVRFFFHFSNIIFSGMGLSDMVFSQQDIIHNIME